MINKFFKTIHIKYSRFFEFIFFLRYLIGIFFIFIFLLLSIPSFFNYEKKVEIIKSHLFENYNFKIEKYETIKFQGLLLPRLEFKNAEIIFEPSSIKSNIKILKIYPKFLSIYNYKNFRTNKIVLENNDISLEFSDLKLLKKNLFNQKNKLQLDNLNLKINNKNKLIMKLENIKFSNFGYSKNVILGKVFDKKFKIIIGNDFDNVSFKLYNSGISADIKFDEIKKNNLITGVFKSKILNTNLKFNFNYDNKVLNIYNSYFRSKNLSFNNEGAFIFDPFLNINSKFKIENINAQILKKLNLDKLLESKDIIKKININNEVIFKSKRFSNNLIDELNLKIDLSYGRMNYLKSFSLAESFFKCEGNINFLQEYPLLFFDCSIISNDKKNFLKEFSINAKSNNEILKIYVKGNVNILNKKINFKKISMNENYKASKEDLKYFKKTFENMLFDKSFLEIFNFKKIKLFILEIS